MRFFFRRKSASVKKFQYVIVFLQKANNNYARCQVMEMHGFHLRTCRKQSEPSTIRALSTLCKTIAYVFWPVGKYEFFRNRSAFGMKCNSFSLEGEKQLRKVFFLDRSAIGLDWIGLD